MSGKLLQSDRTISAVLLDITGVLYDSGEGGGSAIPGSPQAVTRQETLPNTQLAAFHNSPHTLYIYSGHRPMCPLLRDSTVLRNTSN